MAGTMSRETIGMLALTRRAFAIVGGATLFATGAFAQAPGSDTGRWRLGASTGAYVPLSSLIRAGDSNDTRLAAGPAFALEAQRLVSGSVSVYANGLLAAGTIRLGSSIQPAVVGPSSQVILVGGTAGVVLAGDWFVTPIQPTLRLGGGFKAYVFDLTGADDQVRPSADIGLGFRGIGLGRIEVVAEVRYLPSSFDQGRLPTRGIATQNQRQNDLIFSIGFAIRSGAGGT
jgi:hypothetical protein